MPEVSFFSFLDQVKTGKETFPVTILYGFNEFLGQKIIRAFCDTFLVEKSEFNYRRYYFDSEYNETSWEEIISEANTSSFFVQSRKIIVVTIRDEKKITLQKYDGELLKTYLAKPNPNTILVIYISLNVIKDDFQQVKRQKINKLLKALNSPHLYSIDLDKISDLEVRKYIQRYLKDVGMSITASALDKIMETRDDDFISLLYQLPMLEIAAVENKSIDSEDIDKFITGVEAHSIWDLTDAIESEDAEKYLKILKYLFMNGIGATLIIGTLVTHYNKIYIAKFLLKQKFPVREIGRVLGQHPYFLNKFIHSTRSFSEKRLQHILRLIYDLDYESKTSGEESARLSLQNFAFRAKLMGAPQAR
ncbi:MAG: DNA polymerase III subunit delta [Candidatus Aminicenantes bacterium]|nr:MAG: DNA polymerase III subunit delta [Candidatus Aminicenantes bacterium]